MLVGGGVGLSRPRVICNRGIRSSKISSIGESAREISVEDTEKCHTILNRDQGNALQALGPGVVCSQSVGVIVHIDGE